MTDKRGNNGKTGLLFPAIFTIFVSIYAAGNYYVGLRFFQSIQSLIEPYSLFYWSGYAFLVISLFAGRLGKRFYPGYVNDLFAVTGNYWVGAVYYSLLIWAGIDVLHFLTSLIFPATRIIKYPSFYFGLAVLLLVFLLLLYGTWNARHPQYLIYQSSMLSWYPTYILGSVVDAASLKEMVNRINELDPDVVFLAGDTIDEDVRLFASNKMPEILKKLKSRYGVYAVLGNHEYIGGNNELAVEYLQQAGIHVLVDKCIKVNNHFYVAGRDDRVAGRMNGKKRLELSRLVDGIDHTLPIILLDHQPINLKEGQLNGIDLQLSGHTHAGQFFPNTLISKRVFENSWGYLKKGECQIIVSAGFGTWGPPIRIGSNSEITDIKISFV
ncbi:metallophosphoesterase [Methanosarcina mazei]|nr:metallophosphoesterase [Methanosarcina mazei]